MVCMLEFMKKERKTVQEAAGAPHQELRLTWIQSRFIEAYISNGENITQAYLTASPGCTVNTADREGRRLLGNPRIKGAIDGERARLQKLLNFKREDALRILVGQVTARLSDFSEVFKDSGDKESYALLQEKEYALESVKQTYNTETNTETNELKIISNSERRAALNDLWDKLGLGQGASKGNWFDGLERLADVIREVKGSK